MANFLGGPGAEGSLEDELISDEIIALIQEQPSSCIYISPAPTVAMPWYNGPHATTLCHASPYDYIDHPAAKLTASLLFVHGCSIFRAIMGCWRGGRGISEQQVRLEAGTLGTLARI